MVTKVATALQLSRGHPSSALQKKTGPEAVVPDRGVAELGYRGAMFLGFQWSPASGAAVMRAAYRVRTIILADQLL